MLITECARWPVSVNGKYDNAKILERQSYDLMEISSQNLLTNNEIKRDTNLFLIGLVNIGPDFYRGFFIQANHGDDFLRLVVALN